MNKLLKFASVHVESILSVLLVLSGIGLCFSKLEDGQLTRFVTEHALPLFLALPTFTMIGGSCLGLKGKQLFGAVIISIILIGFFIKQFSFC